MEPSGYGKYRGTSCRKKDLRIMDLIKIGNLIAVGANGRSPLQKNGGVI